MQDPNPTSVAAIDWLAQHADIDIEQFAVLAVLKVVGKPEEVQITLMRGRQTTTIEFEVAKTDMGRLIGANGHTIRAIRSIIGAACGGTRREYNIQVIEDDVDSVSRDGQRRHLR